jgi:outer membrane protein TolC
MEELALSQNAELREQFYNARIASLETRKALIKLLPGLSFDYGLNYDDDKYLINQQWQDAGLTISYNLLNILSAPSRMKVAEMGVKLAEARRMALQMALLTKVHLARHQYDDAMRQWQRAEAIYDVDRRLSELALSREKTQTASNLDRIAANVTTILSSVRRYHAMAKVHEAASRVQASLGLEPRIGSLDDTELPELKKQIHQFLERWASPAAPAESFDAKTSDVKAGPASASPAGGPDRSINGAPGPDTAWRSS